MNAEIIAIGSEMLTPDRLDTNSLFLTGQLNKLGIEVVAKHVVGDDRERLAITVRRAVSAADLVILSGGLGPTEDDLTRESVALALDKPLHFDQSISDEIESRFRRMNRTMPEINKRQAMVIEDAEVLPNDRGTAPGQWVNTPGATVIILPGPPYELQSMFTRECLPRLTAMVPPLAIRTRVLRVSGMSESDLDQTISPIYRKYDNPVTTVLAHGGDIQVHLRARCETAMEAEALSNEVASQIEAVLGDRIYSTNGDPLEAVIGHKLAARGETLVIAESATGGGLSDRFSMVPGASKYFLGSIVTYSGALKTELLGVSPELLRAFGPVSREVAEAMAIGARARTGATYSISLTGNAGPTSDAPGAAGEAPVGHFYVGIATPHETTVTHRVWPTADRPRVRAFAAQMALDLLNKKLG